MASVCRWPREMVLYCKQKKTCMTIVLVRSDTTNCYFTIMSSAGISPCPFMHVVRRSVCKQLAIVQPVKHMPWGEIATVRKTSPKGGTTSQHWLASSVQGLLLLMWWLQQNVLVFIRAVFTFQVMTVRKTGTKGCGHGRLPLYRDLSVWDIMLVSQPTY